jgi:hypothetical protein
MTIQLPQDLVWALNQLGFGWPDSDEDKLDQMGQAWRTFATTLDSLVAEADKHAQSVWTGNRGEAIAAFQESWSARQAPLANLRDGAEAAAMIGASLSAAAAIVVALKLKIIAELAFFARVCAIAAAAAKTPWTAVGAVAAVVAARIAAQLAIEAAINLALEALLDG